MRDVAELKKYLWLSQAVLFVGLLICSVIMPSVARSNGGVSNYGNHWSTVAFYSLGFLLNALFIYLASKSIVKVGPHLVGIARSLMLLSLFTLIVFISTFPRHFSFTYSDIHDYLGIVLYGYEFSISVWIVLKRPTRSAMVLLSIQAVGSLIGLLSALEVFHLLFIGQVVASLGFGLLLCTALPDVVEAEL